MRKLTVVAFVIFSAICRASDLTLQRQFTADDDVQLFSVSIAAPATVDIRSYAYAGGTISTGTSVHPGGFDTILTLFNASGVFIDDNDDGAGVATDPNTGLTGDARLTETLTPGNYIAALTQYDNFSLGNLSEGFTEAGNPNFTADPTFTTGGPCPGNTFRDISGTSARCRSGNWTVDFGKVGSVAPVPEPSVLLLGSLGMALLLAVRCRNRRKAIAVACGLVAAFASVSVNAQTTSGPDYSNVTDFLNGQRTLLNVTDLQVFRQSMSRYNFDDDGQYVNLSNNLEALQVTTSNSQQTPQQGIIYNTTSSQYWDSDSSKPAFTFSAFMFNQAAASTLTTMSNFQQSGNFALWLQNVSGLQGGPGWWEPLAGIANQNPNPNVTSGVVADFTQDGYDDLALSFDDGRLLALTPKDVNNVFANFNESITTFDVFKAIAAGDFEGNGRREIAGLSVQSNGSLKLEIYTVDPTSLATTLASSLALTMPQGVSANTPIKYAAMARGRFTGAGHDQLAVAFATTTGSPVVEVIDFALNTLNPTEGPQMTENVTIPGGFLEVKTGKFALPGNSYDQMVVHVSSTSSPSKFFHIVSVDPTSLALSAHGSVTYDQIPCAVGIQVGNFDHRQSGSPNLNSQVALMYCDTLNPPLNIYPYNAYFTF